MLVDHLFQCRISPWPKTAEIRGFCTGVTDGWTDGRTDGRKDRLSYRDAFLTSVHNTLFGIYGRFQGTAQILKC